MPTHLVSLLVFFSLAGPCLPQDAVPAAPPAPTGGGAASVAPQTTPAVEPAAAAQTTPAAAMNAATFLPVGVPSYDVRMPEFAGDKLTSRTRAEKLVRIDDSHLDLTHMNVERFRPDGSLDYLVTIERGFYDLNTGRLVSSTPTRMIGRDMEIHGDGCDYGKDADMIKILGKVTSYLYLNKKKTQTPGDAPHLVNPPAPHPDKP